MRSFPRSRAAALAACPVLAACVALAAAAAGCASPAAPAPRSSPAATGLASPSPPSTGTPERQAEAEAARMLTAFTPPSGARAVSRSPVPSSPLSAGPQGSRPSDDDVVTRTAWWLAPGDPQQLLSWEVAHIGSPDWLNGSGMNGPGVYNEFFELPAVPGLFGQRELTVSAVAAGHGRTAIRVDAMVDWIPARAPGDTVPATARVAVLTETKDTNIHGKPPVIMTATLTDPKQVATLAAYLNRLPVNPPGAVYSCPAAIGGGSIAVSFRARTDGPGLAGAGATFAGCAFLTFTKPGQSPTGIGGPAAGNDLLTEVDRVADLHWKVP
jgi:hypothetical protein